MSRLDHLEVVTGSFLRDLEAADPSARCASIRWTVAELAAHLGEVHRWAALNARYGKRHPRTNVPELGVPVVDWYRESRDILLDTLHELDVAAPAYTLSKIDRTVGFWHRRQLFESLVHLWDLRSAGNPAAAAPTDVPPEVHADGVSELFDVFLPRSGALEPLDATVALEATDTGDRWVFGPAWERASAGPPDATVTATAADLLLYTWNRAERVEQRGDPEALRRFEKAHIRP